MGKGRAIKTCWRGIALACRDKHRAAIFDILRHVVEIEQWQHPAAVIAVKDDQVELFEFLGEKLTRGECDQRKLVNGRTILFFWRAQNGEMNQIYRGVRFEQIAPRPLARMRLARDQQHAQILAHALCGDYRLVVGGRELARSRFDFQFDDIQSRMRKADRDIHGLARSDAADFFGLVSPAYRQIDAGTAILTRMIDDTNLGILFAIDDAKAWCTHNLQPAVEFVRFAGQHRVYGNLQAEILGVGRYVMNLTIRYEDHTSQAVRRYIGKCLA